MLCIEPIGEPCWTDGRTASLVRAILELHSKELCKSEDFTALGTLRGVQWVGLGSNLKTRNRAFWLTTSAAILLRICWEQQHRTWRALRADGSTAVSPCGGRDLHSNSAMLLFVATVAYLFCKWQTPGAGPEDGREVSLFALVTSWGTGHKMGIGLGQNQRWCKRVVHLAVAFSGGTLTTMIWFLLNQTLEGKEQQWVSHRGWNLFVPSKSLPDMLVYLLVGTLCVMTVYVVVISSHLGFGDWSLRLKRSAMAILRNGSKGIRGVSSWAGRQSRQSMAKQRDNSDPLTTKKVLIVFEEPLGLIAKPWKMFFEIAVRT